MTVLTVVAEYGAVEFVDILAAGGLVQAVNVLGNDGVQPARFLQAGQHPMGRVGAGIGKKHFIVVETVELLRFFAVKAVAQYGFRREVILLIIQPIHAAKVGDSALRGDPCAAEKYDVTAVSYNLYETI